MSRPPVSEQPPSTAGDALAFAGLALVLLFLFADILLRGRVLYERDINQVWHGQVESFVRSVAAGSWPVWDPYLSFGQPFLANPGTQVLYPWTWLNLLFSPALVYTVYAVGHLLFAGAGLYLLARRLGLSRGGAFTGAAIWMASGPLLSLVSLWHHLAGAAWMPWVVLAADAALRSPGVGRSVLLGAAFGAQILAGSADMCAMTVLVTVCHALTIARGQSRNGLVRLAGAALLGSAFAVALSAALWLPAVDNARRSGRWDMGAGSRTLWSVHPAQMLQTLLPLLPAEVPLSRATREALFDVGDPFLNSLYVGLPAMALAAASLAGPRPPWLFAFVALAASVLALGRHTAVYSLAVDVLPPLKVLRYPSKAMILAVFAGALLCAFGFDVWADPDRSRARRWRLLVVVPALLGTGLVGLATYAALHLDAWGAGLLQAPRPGVGVREAVAPALRKLVVAAVLGGAAAGLAMVRSRWPQRRDAAAGAVAVLAIAGLSWTHRDLNPTAPPDLYRERPPILGVLAQDRASRLYVFDYGSHVLGKVYRRAWDRDMIDRSVRSPLDVARALQSYLTPPTGSRWGFFGSYENDIYSLQPAPLRHLTLVLRAAEETPLHELLLRLGSVDHVVALHREGLEGLQPVAVLPSLFVEAIRVFRVPDPLPRAYAVAGTRVADGLQAYRALADPSFDLRGEVVLPEGGDVRGPAPAGECRILELRPDRVRIAADLDRAGYVILTDAYDPGWKATVDGRSVPVLRANTAFRAVPVGQGRHVVEMVYRPLSILVGAAVSVAAIATGMTVALARLRGH